MASALIGSVELDRKLVALKDVVRGRILRSAVRAGIRPAERLAKVLIPKGSTEHRTYKKRLVAPGFASRNIRVITVLSPDKNKASAVMSVRKEAFYATQFVETRKGKSKDTGRPWLEPAMANTRTLQETALGAQLKKRIEAIAKGNTVPT